MKSISLIYEVLKEFLEVLVLITSLIAFLQSQKKNIRKAKKTTSKK